MSTEWSEIAKSNPFAATAKDAASRLEPPTMEKASALDRRVITTTDGRTVPVYVEGSSRSVYPVRKV